MGSGVEIREALKKYGRKSFVKEILFEYETKEEMLAKERELVTKEFCMREDTYNRIEGGGTYVTEGMITVKDKEGKMMKVYCNDPRYLSGELIPASKNVPNVKLKNIATVKDIDGNIFKVNVNDERYLSGELVGVSKGYSGKQYCTWGGKKHTDETKEKMSEKAKKRIGEKNSQYGTCWVTNGSENKKIKKENLEEWFEKGYLRGRK